MQVDQGQSLLFVGGGVSLNGGGLFAPGGRIELGGLVEPGSVGLSVNGSELSLSFPEGVGRGSVSLDNRAEVNVRSGGGGNIALNAQNLNMAGASVLRAGIEPGLGSVEAQAGNIEVNTTGTIDLTGESFIGNAVQRGGVGNTGDINITTGSLSLRDGAFISVRTFGAGNGGNINVDVHESAVFDGETSAGLPSGVFSEVSSEAVGNGGDINLTVGSLSLTNGAQVSASLFGRGEAGNINLDVREAAIFDGESSDRSSSGVFSNVLPRAVGNGGDINLTAGSLLLTNGAQVSASTRGRGNAGNVNIDIGEAAVFDGESSDRLSSGAFSEVSATAQGNGGSLNLAVGSLSLTNGAQVSASTFGRGDAGRVTIDARDAIFFQGVSDSRASSGAYSRVEVGGVGRAGGINITTGSLSVSDGAMLSASTFGRGEAGSVTIDARDAISFDGVGSNGLPSGAYSRVAEQGIGQGGGLNITAGSLLVTDGALLSASTFGQGDAGSIQITTGQLIVQDQAQITVSGEGTGNAGNLEVEAGSIVLDNQGQLIATTESGNGGNITLEIEDLLQLRRNSQISTTAGGAGTGGDGGNITLNTGFIVAVPEENSDITANAFEGRGGNIDINAEGVFGIDFRDQLTPESDITASSEFGLDGVVAINRPDIDPTQGLAELPANLVDASGLIDRRCTAGKGAASRSSFTVTGRGGLPPSPSDFLSSQATVVEWVSLDEEAKSNISPAAATRMPATDNPIVEAQGWIINQKGQVVLVAQAPSVTPDAGWQNSADCRVPPTPSLPQP